MSEPIMAAPLPEGDLTPRLAGRPSDEGLVAALQTEGLDLETAPPELADHGRDWWPLALGWLNASEVPSLPAVVVRAHSVDDVVATLAVARSRGVPVTAQAGRSGVVGGAIPVGGSIALDLTGLDKILEIDEQSGTVTVEAGCFGPDLERQLGERGLTVGHFPQSFDISTVGGWLACRGAGQYSNRFGKIEDIVRGLTVVLADGSVITTGGHGPRQSVGPDLTQLFVGSEGTLGIITSATLVARRRAPDEARAAYSFDTFADGLEACRRILQRDSHPAVLRLYDAVESQRSFSTDRCALVVLDEGDPRLVAAQMAIVSEECAGGRLEDEGLVAHWLERRNDVGQLAPLWRNGFVVDTIEVAGPWSVLAGLFTDVIAALSAVPGTLVASAHQSHAYLDGACLYFTFVGRPESDPEAYYRSAWDAATSVVLAAGGALSHHHGVGRNRARFARAALAGGFEVLCDLKSALDPRGILNPGVLGLGEPTW